MKKLKRESRKKRKLGRIYNQEIKSNKREGKVSAQKEFYDCFYL